MSDGRQTPQICNGGEAMWAPNYPYHPPPPPPNPGYYYYPSPPPPPPQTAEQQQQFWDHYNAMCSYVAEMNNSYGYPPYGYPHHMYTPPPPQPLQYTSDSDECGYSSTDEMNYYAAYFKKYPPPIQPYRTYYQDNRSQTPQIVITPSRSYGNSSCNSDHVSDSEKESNQMQSSESTSPSVNCDSGETTADDGSDTEVEEENSERPQGLQTIRSVPDISIYKDSSTSDIQSQNSETDEPDEETNEEEEDYEEDLPHQLSVIFEESEHSEVESLKRIKCRAVDDDTTSEGESSTATLDNGDDTDDDVVDAESSTVLVRLPLKLKFSKTENNEDLTTVIVGDSEIESSPEAEVRPGDLIIQEVKRVEDDPDVSVTFTIPKKKNKPPEVISDIADSENNTIKPRLTERDSLEKKDELSNNNNVSDSNDVICDKETSVVVSCDDNSEDRCKSESPIDFWKELSCDDIPSKSHVPADISVSITLPPKSLSKSGSRSPFNNFTSESDDSKPEESDGHWEDDSSSTSVQTVRIGKHSGSDHFSGSEIENCATADEVDEDVHKFSSPCEVGGTSNKNESLENDHKHVEDDISGVPIEDLLYDDMSSSSEDDDDDESSTSSSSSESSEESSAVSEQSKEPERIKVTTNGSNKPEEKCDDDVFINEGSKCETGNHLSVDQKPRKVRGTSCKSQDESEEDDSGVTSDMSRHISETDTEPECGSELRKLTPYQRASTHSRLFKLLQDECSTDTEEQNPQEENTCVDAESISSRKERLSLPLQSYTPSDPDSMSSSSGINSPVSPTVNDRLVRELVQSLLTKKKSRHFRKLPMEKLYAAALRILQEDMDPYDTLSSTSDDSFQHSPISESTASQTNNNTATNSASQSQEVYGGNYYDYCDYYNTWGNPYYYSDVEDSLGYDIIPSRAFKLLQERAQTPLGFSSGVIEGLVAKCPRVLSSKDVPKDVSEVPVSDSCPQASSSTET